MPVVHLTGPDDVRAADYRAIPDPALLRSHGHFIVEGRLLVQRLLDQPASRFRIRSLLLNAASYDALRATLAPIEASVDIFIASAEDITAIGGFDFHRGCLALVGRPAPLAIADLDLDTPGDARLVLLEGISNADNVGGIFRNAAAFGARAVILGPRCCDPLYRKATRTSMGATLVVPFATIDPPDWPGALEGLRALGYRLVALTPRRPAVTLDAFADAVIAGDVSASPAERERHALRLALLVGSEGAGLSDAALAAASDRVTIPMTALVDSLNVATAAGIALHRMAALR